MIGFLINELKFLYAYSWTHIQNIYGFHYHFPDVIKSAINEKDLNKVKLLTRYCCEYQCCYGNYMKTVESAIIRGDLQEINFLIKHFNILSSLSFFRETIEIAIKSGNSKIIKHIYCETFDLTKGNYSNFLSSAHFCTHYYEPPLSLKFFFKQIKQLTKFDKIYIQNVEDIKSIKKILKMGKSVFSVFAVSHPYYPKNFHKFSQRKMSIWNEVNYTPIK